MKKILGIASYQLFLFTMLGSVLFVALIVLPTKASALEMTAQTSRVLPPGGNACALIVATAFTPYIYDGALHSFEFTVPDASYVALIGSAGDTPLSFQLMTRSIDASGALRVHVDLEATPIRGTLPLQVTLLSARTGQPVCLSVVSINVGSGPTQTSVSAPQPKPVATVTPTTPKERPSTSADTVVPSTTSAEQAETADTTPTASVVSSIWNPLRSVCASEASAYRLWLILLVLFTLVVGAALWAEFPMSLPWARTPERIATLILALLLVLLAFWYLSVPCRAALWMPLLAFLIAVLGLLAAFWNHPRVTQILLIQDSNL